MRIYSIKMNTQRGFSLVELMIAVALGIFLTGGMIALFVNSNQSYRVQENLSRLQENGHFATNFLTQDIRMADYWGCLRSSDVIVNNLNSGSDYDDFANAITTTNNTGLNGSDSITIKRVEPSDIYITSIPATDTAPLTVSPANGLAVDDVVLISDCSAGNVFQITGITGNDIAHVVAVQPADTDPKYPSNADNKLEKKYGTDAQLYKMVYSTYTIAAGPDNQPALFKSVDGATPRELVEGIESMQIKYGVDADADNTADFYVDSSSLTAAQMNQVISVRVSLVATTIEDNLSTQAVPYTVFGATTTPTDRKIRRVFNTTIAVRNRLP
jgi:type IV pilus assembly protein PilW